MLNNFGEAVAALHIGAKVQRQGWNGKNMYLFLVSDWEITSSPVDQITPLLASSFICMKTADNKYVPWLASQTDVLANDWVILV